MEQRYTFAEQKSKNVFKVISKADQKAVILKKVSFSAITPKEKEYIVNEVNTLLQMNYVHILRYLDYEINKKDMTVDIVMDSCEGGSVQDLLNKAKSQNKRIDEDQVWRIFYQLTQALDYIHRGNIIHRNINPSNIYFKERHRKNVKLGGFTFAKKINYEENLQSTVLPNTYYLSPEQIESGVCTKQTDIWALGSLLYQICTLQHPFKQPNQFQRLKMIKQIDLKKIPYYSAQLNRLILWCLKKKPEKRPTLYNILSSPEINLRIRQRRYMQKMAQVQAKEEMLKKLQHDLMEKEEQILKQQKPKHRYESLKKRGSEMVLIKQFSVK